MEMLPKPSFRVVQSIVELEGFLEGVPPGRRVSYDTETGSPENGEHLRPEKGSRICGHSLMVERGDEAVYVPVRHAVESDALLETSRYANLDPGEVARALKPLLENPAVLKVGANPKFDLRMIQRDGVEPRGLQCVLALARVALWDVDHPGNWTLKELGKRLFGYEPEEEARLKKWLKKHKHGQHDYWRAPVELVGPYACCDAWLNLCVLAALEPRLDEGDEEMRAMFAERGKKPPPWRGLRKLWELENALAYPCADMECEGFPVDEAYLEEKEAGLREAIEHQRGRVWLCAKCEFDLDSPQQLGRVLYDKLKLKCPKKTPKGGRSTDEEALAALKGQHDIVGPLGSYRFLSKMLNTYVLGIKEATTDGRCHCSIHPAATRSGRLSASDPNLQNLPVRRSAEIRAAFTAPEGWRLLFLDLSQIELRVLAHFSKEPALLRAFEAGMDGHVATYSLLTGTPVDKVTQKQRGEGKTLNYAILFGMGAALLARRMTESTGRRVGEAEAKGLLQRYWRSLPRVRELRDLCIKTVKHRGRISTLFGRLRAMDMERSHVLLNQLIQGSAADLFKAAILRCWSTLRGRRTRLIVPIHDELVFLLHPDEEWLIPLLVHDMTDWPQLCLPLEADAAISDGPWPEKKGVKVNSFVPEMLDRAYLEGAGQLIGRERVRGVEEAERALDAADPGSYRSAVPAAKRWMEVCCGAEGT